MPAAAFQGSDAADVTLAAVGDVLLHSQLQRQGFADPAGFRSLWRQTEPLLSGADIAIANLEGPVAEDIQPNRTRAPKPVRHYDNHVYTGYPLFNYPPAALHALTAAGIDLVSIANNHSYDRGTVGFEATIDALEQTGLAYAGGKRRQAPPEAPDWGLAVSRGGDRLAFVSCSYGFNVATPEDRQAPLCFADRRALLSTIARLSCRADIAAVVLLPHWGNEYVVKPTPEQREFAFQALEAGATAVIGAHPHVVQPVETYRTSAGRTGVIAYSLGNFASAQREDRRRTSIILYLGFNRSAAGKLEVANIRYLPIETVRRETPDGTRFDITPVWDREAASVRYQDLVSEGALLADARPATQPGLPLPEPATLPTGRRSLSALRRDGRRIAFAADQAALTTAALIEASKSASDLQDRQQAALLAQAAAAGRLHKLAIEADAISARIASARAAAGAPAAGNAAGRSSSAATPQPAPSPQADRLIVSADALFEASSARIRHEAAPLIGKIAETLKAWEAHSATSGRQWRIEVQGHADARPMQGGAYRSNHHLSAERALAMVEALQRQGVAGKRLYASGIGSAMPLAQDDSAGAHAQNRRVELIIRNW